MTRPPTPLAKFACLSCRTVMKRVPSLPTDPAMPRAASRPIERRRCATCGGDSYWVGSNFRAPPRDDRKAWAVVARLVRAGLPYCKIYAPLPRAELVALGLDPDRVRGARQAIGPWPTTMAEAEAFIARHGALALPFWCAGDAAPGAP